MQILSYHVIFGLDMFDMTKGKKDKTNQVSRKLATNERKMKNLRSKKKAKRLIV